MQKAYILHCARKGTTPEKLMAKIGREGLTLWKNGKPCGAGREVEGRNFPRDLVKFSSTAAYVREYYRINGVHLAGSGYPRDFDPNAAYFGGELNLAPFTYPEGPEVTVETEE